jgi:hypothetical protein
MRRFVSYKVTPGEECKVEMPPCSALEIKHAALMAGAPPKERCTLSCDLATHQFVLCSLPPGAIKMQASLGTVVTNDPDQTAWLFLKASGPRAFHVLGRIVVDRSRAVEPAAKIEKAGSTSAASSTSKEQPALPVSASDDEDWPTAASVAPSTSANDRGTVSGKGKSSLHQANGDDEGESEDIEVLLPDGDDSVEYPSSMDDSDEESFVSWMQERAVVAGSDASDKLSTSTSNTKKGTKRSRDGPTKSKESSFGAGSGNPGLSSGGKRGGGGTTPDSGGSRSQRRRAAEKRRKHESP